MRFSQQAYPDQTNWESVNPLTTFTENSKLGSLSECMEMPCKARKRLLLRHFILKLIILPRQARDKQKERLRKE
jgi:hypothetical protein